MDPQSEYGFQYPFGEVCCENEIEVLQEHYSEFFYDKSRFNEEAIDPEVYLIVGRRGSGKTSLTKYFGFQNRIKNAHNIDVDEPAIYDSIISRVVRRNYVSPDLAVNDVRKIWEYLVWSLIFHEYRDYDPLLENAGFFTGKKGKISIFIGELLKHVLSKYLDDSGTVADVLSDVLADPVFTRAKEKVIEFTRKEPVIIAIDTFERYDRNNDAMMAVTAALIQCASNFNIAYARKGIHIKAFVSAEIFPYIAEGNIPNTTKFIRDPLYMLWRPKDLIRLISWRFYKSLVNSGYPLPFDELDWDNFDEVRANLWTPFFGESIRNLNGKTEQSLPYVLRHTQMRPRQLVILCNQIARMALKSGKFPRFKDINIARAISESETLLAKEVLNSYDLIYPGAPEIVQALAGAPASFPGNYLDQVAKKTARAWLEGNYSISAFHRLVSELGIVGRVRKKDEKAGIIEADFEYAMSEPLILNDTDECVIHPMFYRKLQIQRVPDFVVLPFPDHEDYREIHGKNRPAAARSNPIHPTKHGH
jgi:hypothetical protein